MSETDDLGQVESDDAGNKYDNQSKLMRELISIGAAWKKDSSLEKWFPLTAEELTKLKAKIHSVKGGLSELQKWSKYLDVDPIVVQAITTALKILDQ